MPEMGNAFEAKKPEKEVLLELTGLLAGKNFETQSIRVGRTEYEFPSPEALESELFKLLNKIDNSDLEFQKQLLEFTDRFTKALKEGRALLNTARMEEERASLGNANGGQFEITLRVAKGLFATAQHILLELGE